jgi:hypothetical protein
VLRAGQRDAARLVAQHRAHQPFFAFEVVVGIAEQQLQPVRFERIGEAAHGVREVGARQRRHQHRDEFRTARR